MYAIVEIAGQQFKVEKDQKVYVNRLATDEGETVSFNNVLLLADGNNITLGAPAIDGAQVGAKVLKHLKGDKVIVFKKKRRKGYRVKNGHRQALSEIVIESIIASGAKKADNTKKPAAEKPAAKPETTTTAKKTAKKADDLKKIEGAGPKAAEALTNAGFNSFDKIAAATAEQLSNALTEASSRLAHIVTDTWPKQAKLAAEGKWDELKAYQESLDGGIEK